MTEILWRILVGCLIAMAVFITNRTLLYLGFRRAFKRVTKKPWLSRWETKANAATTVNTVNEEVKLSISWLRGRVKISNRRSPGSKSIYDAFGNLRGQHLIGRYISDDGADGTFMLTISPDHSYMYGFWMGKSFDEPAAVGKLVLAIDQTALANAIEKLSSLQISQPGKRGITKR